MTGRARVRAGVVAGSVAILVLGVPAAASASASGSTVDGPVGSQGAPAAFTADGPVALTSTVNRSFIDDGTAVMLALTDPTGAVQPSVATTTGSGMLAKTVQTTCMYDVGTCTSTTRRPGRNGVWTLALSGDSATASLTFSLTIPPRVPAGITADSFADGTFSVAWVPNDEPDLLAYDVLDASGATVVQDLDPTKVCSATQCSTSVTAAQTAGLDTSGFEVRGVRRATPTGTRSTALTATSAAAPTSGQPSPTATAGADPSASSSADPSASPGSSAGATPGATASAGAAPAPTKTVNASGTTALSLQNQSDLSKSFNSFAPSAGVPKLPPLPVLAAPEDESGGDGTYAPTLTYPDGDPNDLEDGTNDVNTKPSLAASIASSAGLSEFGFWGSMGFGALLAVTGAHALRWSRKPLD